MKKFLYIFAPIIIGIFILYRPIVVEAVEINLLFSNSQDYYIGTVLEIVSQEEKEVDGDREFIQLLRVKLSELEGVKTIEYIYRPDLDLGHSLFSVEDRVVVAKDSSSGEEKFYIYDQYRIVPLLIIVLIFTFVVFLFSGVRGLMALGGLLISILIIYNYLVPQIIRGSNPVLIGMFGTVLIAVLSIYTSHGLNKRTSVALVSTIITLGLAILFSMFFVSFANLFGLGQEEALLLQASSGNFFDLKGLLLCGIIIGTLGVLDDVTTAQVATVDEIRKANLQLSARELYRRGLSVGREHISAMVNTLVMAYAGASLPLFLLFYANQDRPFWVILNSEFIAEEIVRTLAGSLALVLAVPISTFLAAYVLPSKRGKKSISGACGHQH